MPKPLRRFFTYLSLTIILNNAFLPVLPGISAWAKEISEAGIVYQDGERWCGDNAANFCSAGNIESTPCAECQNNVCVDTSTCGHLGQECCSENPKCYEGADQNQGFLGLGGCQCVLEPGTVLYVNNNCQAVGDKFCSNGNIHLCGLENGTLVEYSSPCLYGTCADDKNCAEAEPWRVPPPTPTPISLSCTTPGVKRCQPGSSRVIQVCDTNLLWTFSEVCPLSCDPPTATCFSPCSRCRVPGRNYCTVNGNLVTCDPNGCAGDIFPCEFGCLENEQETRCKTHKEIFAVLPGQPYHFNDPILSWLPLTIPGMLTQLFYDDYVGAVKAGDQGIPINTQIVIQDINKYLMLNEAYRNAVAGAPAALFLLAALAAFAPLYSPAVIQHIEIPRTFPDNVYFSSEMPASKFVTEAREEVIDEIKLVAKQNRSVAIKLISDEEMQRETGSLAISKGGKLYGLCIYPRDPLCTKDYLIKLCPAAKYGTVSHELQHFSIHHSGGFNPIELRDTLHLVADPFGPQEVRNILLMYDELITDYAANSFLVENGLPRSDFVYQSATYWENALAKKLGDLIMY